MDTRDYGGFILQNNPELREIAEGLNIFPGGGRGVQGCPQFLPGGKNLTGMNGDPNTTPIYYFCETSH